MDAIAPAPSEENTKRRVRRDQVLTNEQKSKRKEGKV